MPSNRLLFIAVLLLGLATSQAFRSPGALTASDALVAAAARGASVLDPPLPLTTRITGMVVNAVRAMEPTSALFPLVHLAAGLLLAFAAAAAAVVAARAAGATKSGRRPDAAMAAGIAVAGAVLFGRVTGFGGVAGSGVAMTLLLLSGAALAWNLARPRAAVGGFLLGLAVIEHPLALLMLPGFLAMAAGLGLRAPDEDAEGRALRNAGFGFVAGLFAYFLPGAEPNGPALVAFAPPSRWFPHLGELALAHLHAVGPLGIVAALFGIAALHNGETRAARPFLPMHAAACLAFVFLDTKTPDVLLALASWSFLFFLAPAAAAGVGFFERRAGAARAPVLLVGAAAISGAVLFAWNATHLDRRAERDVEWARASFSRLSEKGILLTANPVHWAFVADGDRPDLDVLFVDAPQTLAMRRSVLGVFAPEIPEGSKPARTMSAEFLREIIAMNFAHRPIFLEPSLYFDAPRRKEILGDAWQANPFGLATRIGRRGVAPDEAQASAAAILWDEYDVTPGTPPSPLRDGMTGDEYFARSLLQSAALYLDSGLRRDAEREFLFALALDAPNPNIPAFGLARIFFERTAYEEAALTVRRWYDENREGAWLSKKLLGTTLLHLGDPQGAVREFEEAFRLCPESMAQERRAIDSLLQGARAGRRLPGRVPGAVGISDSER